jgi:hypothetical protein
VFESVRSSRVVDGAVEVQQVLRRDADRALDQTQDKVDNAIDATKLRLSATQQQADQFLSKVLR